MTVGFNWWREAEPDSTSPQAIAERVEAEWRAERRRERVQTEQPNGTVWPAGWPHEAPEHQLTITEAHQITQRHRECRADQCPRKAAALQTLIDSGRMTPDTSRQRP